MSDSYAPEHVYTIQFAEAARSFFIFSIPEESRAIRQDGEKTEGGVHAWFPGAEGQYT